jgi:hypothetical protein
VESAGNQVIIRAYFLNIIDAQSEVLVAVGELSFVGLFVPSLFLLLWLNAFGFKQLPIPFFKVSFQFL